MHGAVAERMDVCGVGARSCQQCRIDDGSQALLPDLSQTRGLAPCCNQPALYP